MCGETFTPVSVNNRFCSAECRGEWWAKNPNPEWRTHSLSKRRCFACGITYMGRKGQRICSKECNNMAFQIAGFKWTDNELIYLASINAGYGFKRFVRKLYPSINRGRPRKYVDVLTVLKDFEERTGINWYAELQNPEMMRDYRYCDYVEEFGKNSVPHYQGIKGKRADSLQHIARIKTDKHLNFNWGTLADDARATHDEEE